MTDKTVARTGRRVEVPAGFAGPMTVGAEALARMNQRATDDPDGHWLDIARRLDWVRTPTVAGDWSFDAADFHVSWYADGQLNLAANCLDRHLETRGDKVALIWEPDDPAEPPRRFTYRELHRETCRMANVLAGLGVARGDRVTIYMPMIPEAAFAMLACARIGAIHSVVFGGFSPEALAGRIRDCGSRVLITADEGLRAQKPVPLKRNADIAADHAGGIDRMLVVRRTGADVAMTPGRDVWYHEAVADAAETFAPAVMDADDPLFILYTSGSTGTPKGVLHATGGYLAWASYTHALVFDHREDDVFFSSADIGWVTGHSYTLYGPLSNGGTTVMFEGVPTWPDASRLWRIVDRHGVTVVYTAPTAIRALEREGDAPVAATRRASLRLLGSVGEPINPEAWNWYHDVVGEGRCPIVDTWWQTETGGMLIAPVPGAVTLKPGSATRPLPGIRPALVDADGRTLEGATSGNLVLTASWPGQMRGVWGDPERFFQTYFTAYPGRYFTGDGCRRDEDGDYWITGRVDDVINVSGHRLGTAEVEAALNAHPAVIESAVVGVPHDIKGQGIYAYAILAQDAAASAALNRELAQWVRQQIGPIATPDAIQFAPALPKTRSGKIMRRILRKIAEHEYAAIGDVSTLADPQVVEALIAGHKAIVDGTAAA
ncbi:acetate--CoA ligase [Sphingomonas sp. CCH18-H6]|uniref:acetate--CoA ligase n=1 Tax=Sphingomonas sp. CCH18-H6 TaxID=1768787 RepID=UPI000829761A|nr:acetate--CoA ligase [Sphingomonas sp. CCH18-H6]